MSSNALTTIPGNDGLADMSIDFDAVYKALNLNPRDPKAQALFLTCRKYGLDPVLKHAVLISGSLYVTRDGLLHVAHASKMLDGFYAECTGLNDEKTHYVAVATVHRKDMSHPFTMRGRYPVTGRLAKDYGPEMAEKVAMCRALRMAFDVSLCSQEEMWDQGHIEESALQRFPQPKAVDAQFSEEAAPRELSPVQILNNARREFVNEANRLNIDIAPNAEKSKQAQCSDLLTTIIHWAAGPNEPVKIDSPNHWQVATQSMENWLESVPVVHVGDDSDLAGFNDPFAPEGE